ncbi:MAG: DSD1 family PLP-dependent enzyme [Dehalococcoidia bacterium]
MFSPAAVIGMPRESLDTPALLVDLPAMEKNIATMASTFQRAGVNWRPHTKGQKIPAVAHKLIRAGAIGVTCAKVGEAEVMVAGGITDILIANQVIGEPKVRRLVNLLPHADVALCVDSEIGICQIEDAAAKKGDVYPRILVEVDTGMQRCGVPPGEPAVTLARRIHQSAQLRFAGLMAWEGHTVAIPDIDAKRGEVQRAIGLLTGTADLCRQAGLPVDIVSCGGTGDYTISAFEPGITEVEAGGGVWCDAHYRRHMGVQHDFAMTVLTTVISRPTPTRVVVDAGFKTMSALPATPEPIGLDGIRSLSLSAEHGRLELAEANDTLRVGDKLEFVVGYTDSTVVLHDVLYGVRGGRVEVAWPILGRGKLW